MATDEKPGRPAFPAVTVIGSLLAVLVFGGRGIRAMVTGEIRIPLVGDPVDGARQPLLFWGVTAVLLCLGLLGMWAGLDATARWRRGQPEE